MEPLDFQQNASEVLQSADIQFVVIKTPLEGWVESTLLEADFKPVYVPPNEFLYPQMVWQRE